MHRSRTSPAKYRQAIIQHLDACDVYLPAREIAVSLNLPYKAVVDALNALHNQGRVARRGRKFNAAWGPARLAPATAATGAWDLLATAWFGSKKKSGEGGGRDGGMMGPAASQYSNPQKFFAACQELECFLLPSPHMLHTSLTCLQPGDVDLGVQGFPFLPAPVMPTWCRRRQ